MDLLSRKQTRKSSRLHSLRRVAALTCVTVFPFATLLHAGELDHFTWTAMPGTAHPGEPFAVTLEARDADGAVANQFNGTVTLTGVAPGSPVLITEVETIRSRRVEVANLSDAAVDVSGWRLVYYDTQSWPEPRVEFPIPPGTICPPRSVFEVRSADPEGLYPSFDLGVVLAWGGTATYPYAAVALLDAEGRKVDFFCAVSALPAGINAPLKITENDWTGLAVPANNTSSLSYHRAGAYDLNNRFDWLAAAISIGTMNSEIRFPFVSRPAKVAVTPGSVTLANGVWSGTLVMVDPGTNLVLRADDLKGHAGDSAAFTVIAPPALRVVVSASGFEDTPGLIGFGSVSIPSPLTTNLPVQLASSDTNEILVSPSCNILAGQTHGSFAVTNRFDGLLDGTKLATVMARAVGFSRGTAVVTNYDVSDAGLRLWLPATVGEGDGWLSNAVVAVNSPMGRNLTVNLSSSNTNHVKVPATVVINARSNSCTFAFQVVSDGRISGTDRVTITAAARTWPASTAEIVVTDNADTKLRPTLVSQAAEGSGVLTNAGSISILGILPTNIVVSVSNSEPGRLILPDSVVLEAGRTSVVFNVTVPDDVLKQGRETVLATFSAPGFTTASAAVDISDNEVDHLAFGMVPSPQALGQPFMIELSARAIDGQTVGGFASTAQIYAMNGETTPKVSEVTLSNGIWSGNITLAKGSTNVSLIAELGTLTGISNPFKIGRPIIRDLSLLVQDLIYDPVTERLYATVSASGGAYSNSLVRIDPATATIESSHYIGEAPNRLAISDDGRFIYVGLDGEFSVRRFDLNSQSPGPAFSIGDGYPATDLEVMRGHPEVVAVANALSVSVFESGIKRTNQAPALDVIAFNDSDVLYGYYCYTTAFGFYRMLVDNNGVAVQGSSGPLIQGVADIQYDAGRLYTTLGLVVDPDEMKVIGHLPVSGPIRSDSPLNRVYVLSKDSGKWLLGGYDRTTLACAGTIPVPEISGTPSSLVRWGTNGLAFRTTGGQVFLLETELVPQAVSADLSVEQLPIVAPVIVGSNLICNVIVTNRGPLSATGVWVLNPIPAGTTLVSADSTKGACRLLSGQVACEVGTLQPGETASLMLTVAPWRTGLATNAATIVADQVDPVPGNNVSVVIGSVVSAPGTATMRVDLLQASDLVWEPASERLYITVLPGDSRHGNQLVRMNPASGTIEKGWFLGSNPLRVIRTSDPRYLYVVVNGGTQVRRFDCFTGTTDITIDVQTGPRVGDLASLNGRPETVAISLFSPGSSASGSMEFHENGVLRFVGPAWQWFEPGEGPDVLYNFVGTGGLQRYRTLTDRLVLEGATGARGSSPAECQYDAGLLFTILGEVIYGPVPTLVGALPELAPVTRLIYSDAKDGRVYHLGQTGGSAWLRAYSRSRLELLGTQTITGLKGSAFRMSRWGTNGIAFATTGSQLFILQTDLTGEARAVADLVVTQSTQAGVPAATPFTMSVTVSNRGPSTATDVVLTDILPAESSVLSVSPALGSLLVSNGVIRFSLGSIPAGAQVSTHVTVITREVGPLQNSAYVACAEREANPHDNFSSTLLPSLRNTLELPINDMVYDPARARIFASIGPSGGSLSNSVVEIEPATGTVGLALQMSDHPYKLALSEDSQFLYVGLYNTGGVARVDLNLRTNDLYFSLGAAENGFRYTAGDMEAVPGQPHAIAVSISDWSGNVALAVYDDGIPRPNMVPRREYGGTYPIAFSTNSSILYQTVSRFLRTIRVDQSGVTLLSEVVAAVPQNGLQGGNGLLFYNSGYALEPQSNQLAMNLQSSGVIAFSPEEERIYLATSRSIAWKMDEVSLRAFDAMNAREIWSIPFAVNPGNVKIVLPLGTNGVAVATDGGRLYTMRKDYLLPSMADVALTQKFAPGTNAVGQTFVCTLTVSNAGPCSATGVVVSNSIPVNLLAVSSTASKGEIVQTETTVIANLGILASREVATIKIVYQTLAQGDYSHEAFVYLDQQDMFPDDNFASSALKTGPPLLLTINDAAIPEGNGGTAGIAFNLSLSATSSVPIYFRYQTANGTALGGVDYNMRTGLFTFPAGTLSAQLSLASTIRANTSVQSNRFFYLNLGSVTNATLLRTQAIGTIMEDDFRGVTATNISLVEGDSGRTNATFMINLDSSASEPITVGYQIVDGTAHAPADYVSRAGTLRFEPGVTNMAVSTSVFGDTLPEIDETLVLLLADSIGASIATQRTEAIIVNDDHFPILRWTATVCDGAQIRLAFPTIGGRLYQVERCSNLSNKQWSAVSETLMGTGGTLEVFDKTSEGGSAFYRVVMLP